MVQFKEKKDLGENSSISLNWGDLFQNGEFYLLERNMYVTNSKNCISLNV